MLSLEGMNNVPKRMMIALLLALAAAVQIGALGRREAPTPATPPPRAPRLGELQLRSGALRERTVYLWQDDADARLPAQARLQLERNLVPNAAALFLPVPFRRNPATGAFEYAGNFGLRIFTRAELGGGLVSYLVEGPEAEPAPAVFKRVEVVFPARRPGSSGAWMHPALWAAEQAAKRAGLEKGWILVEELIYRESEGRFTARVVVSPE